MDSLGSYFIINVTKAATAGLNELSTSEWTFVFLDKI